MVVTQNGWWKRRGEVNRNRREKRKERKSYENRKYCSRCGQGLPWKHQYSEPWRALRTGVSKAGVHHNLWRLMNEAVGEGGAGEGAPHIQQQTRSSHTEGGKRYKRAPEEQERSGKRPSNSAALLHSATS